MEKRIVIGLLLTLVIIVFVPVYWIREPARQGAALHRQQEEALERGADTYVTLCANCHGPQGQGLIGPALKGTKLEKEALVRVINRGRPTERVPMPAWATEDGGILKTHQVNYVVRFILNWDEHILEKATLKYEAAVPLPTEPVARGKQLYNSVGCNFCHGGGGEGTNFAPPLGGRTREQIVNQVRQPRTPLMPAYTPQHLSDEHLEKLAAFLLTLQPPPTPTPPPAPPGLPPDQAQAIAQGSQLFTRLGCAACHGPEGKGVPPLGPDIRGKTPEAIKKQVRTPLAQMPPFPPSALSDADLERVIAFLLTLQPPPTPTPPPAPPGLPPTQAQAIAQGAQLYARLGCAACHGPEGKGVPPLGTDIRGKTPEAIKKQVRTPLAQMPPFPPSALSDADLEEVIAFIHSLKP